MYMIILHSKVPSSSDLQGPLGRLCHIRHVDTASVASHAGDGPRDQGKILGGETSFHKGRKNLFKILCRSNA